LQYGATLRFLPFHSCGSTCAGEVVECRDPPQRGAEHRGCLDLEWKPWNGCGFRCSGPHPTAARGSLLLTVQISNCVLIRTAPGLWVLAFPGAVSNFDQTIAVHVCCTGCHRGIALPGPNATPPGTIELGRVVLSATHSWLILRKRAKWNSAKLAAVPGCLHHRPITASIDD
jgi:hypothetical protein